MRDNGSAMLAAQTVQGLARWGIVRETTLPFSPCQNGNQEVFRGQIEGRFLPLLETVTDLSLRQLNEATLAWVEMEDNRQTHSEPGLQKFMDRELAGARNEYFEVKDEAAIGLPKSEELMQARAA